MSEAASQEERLVDHTQGYFPMPRVLRATLAQVHKNTAQLVEFIAEQTFGWHSRWVYLTYDEIKDGRKKQNGERMGPGSCLTQDKTVRRAIADALEKELIEIRYRSGGTAYAIHQRFWASSKLIPRWEFFKRTSYSPAADPIEYGQDAVKMTESEQQEEKDDAQEAKTSVKKTATTYQIDSERLSNSQQPTVKKTDEMSDEIRPQEVRREPRNTSPNTSSRKTWKRDMSPAVFTKGEDEKDGPPPTVDASEVDALAQHQANQHILQQLLAEQERLRQIKPSQAGWGEAQRRLRSLAREITRLQALFTLQATAPGRAAPAAAPNQAESLEERRAPPIEQPRRRIRDQGAPADAASAQDTRHERLMKLQSELAQLKRTPSMQLLARQRIPQLEAEIKQLIVEMQESA